jgi:hypothetical protein
VVLDSDGNVVGIKSGKSSGLEGRMLLPTTADAVQALVSGGGNTQSGAYQFAGWAPGQLKVATFFDQSGQLRDAPFQASLTAANAWANADLLTIANPTANSMLAPIPAIPFSYATGNTLLLLWRGFATPEGADATVVGCIGDGTGSVRTGGYELICDPSGRVKFTLRDNSAGSYFSGTGTMTAFEATTEHTVAVCLDGQSKTYCIWVDGQREPAMASNFAPYSSGATIDTAGGNPLWIGGNGRVQSSVQEGIACKVSALHVLVRQAGGAPATVDLAVKNFHRNSRRLIGSEFPA